MPSTKEHLKSMASAIDAIRYYPAQSVFTDFVEMAAIAIRNAYDHTGREEREALYLKLLHKYKPEDRHRFSELLQQLVQALHEEPADILGELYMTLGVASAARGQFFTPPSISNLLAQLAMDTDRIHQDVARRGFITLSEPSCGSGAMVISFAHKMQDLGINFQQHLHVTLVDLDLRAVHMAFIQLSLLHIPAIVVHGNTLTVQEFDHWHTPAHGMGLFGVKLKRGFAIDSDMGQAYVATGSAYAEEDLTLPLLARAGQGNNLSTQGATL
ncbi:N-6 DNA methylase [Pseudomonas sp. P66]|uniref:N-6 DNA methylase n=1 Tax=Pseudomonas arcuscaelestis TaxID=2710591 RepID=A0ABS2BY51_9PSED|nr:N-6 DNA methylase [Pseudomonas arcuscaelestis]MBM5458551.1 N-6 DNA methylase [Pseudomonas arcuscaelestis]